MTVKCEDVDFDLRVAEFRINGYVVLEDVLSVNAVDRIRAAFLPMLEHIRKREAGIADREMGRPANRLRAPTECKPLHDDNSVGTSVRRPGGI